MPMFLVTFMALLFWIATWLTIQIEVRAVPAEEHRHLEVYVPRPTWLTSKSERLFSAEAPRIRKGPQLQAAGLRPRN